MEKIKDIANKRWFMGKGKVIQSTKMVDCANVGGARLQIIQVDFEGGKDFYAVVEDESKMGLLLAAAFGNTPNNACGCCKYGRIFKGERGRFEFFNSPKSLTQEGCSFKNVLSQAEPLCAEQSNSAFFVKGAFFFKMFRRLQGGIHPEQEILQQLNKMNFHGVPQLLGYGQYKSDSGETFALGILEDHIADAKNAWDLFTAPHYCNLEFLKRLSCDLGTATAQMHKALKDLQGTAPKEEEPPFEKLQQLLKINHREDLINSVKNLQQKNANQNLYQTDLFKPQRIHGDFHLGQVLWKEDSFGKNESKFTLLDFEGEPTRTLDFRRRLRSPAVDVAGMLRSFAYATAATARGADFEQSISTAFLEGYSHVANIDIMQLRKATQPYLLNKAVYEACYELEFRPSWFWIPEQVLKV